MKLEQKQINNLLHFGMGICVGVILMLVLTCIIIEHIEITQDVANEICYNLTGIEGVEAVQDSNFKSRLICEVPSFDATPNIIIRTKEK